LYCHDVRDGFILKFTTASLLLLLAGGFQNSDSCSTPCPFLAVSGCSIVLVMQSPAMVSKMTQSMFLTALAPEST
jgi:hypothetical protein